MLPDSLPQATAKRLLERKQRIPELENLVYQDANAKTHDALVLELLLQGLRRNTSFIEEAVWGALMGTASCM